MVSGNGAVESGRFRMLKFWGRKGISFGVERGINSFRII